MEFRDLSDLERILYTCGMGPVKSYRLYQISPSDLLFNCGTETQPHIHFLDCTSFPPKFKCKFYTAEYMYWDMCFVQEQNKKLVIVTGDGLQEIHAYNADTKSLEWKKEIEGMENAGIAADGHGHLFICDGENGCVHMLSVLDGRYLGCLITQDELGLGASPCWAAWSEETASLIVAHAKGSKRFISVIKLQ